MKKEPDFVPDANQALPDTPEMRHAMKQIASGRCADFRRRFPGVEVATRLVASGKPHWFLDLLRLWRPSGGPSGDDGLRLAVRDGYLTFYRLGQSVARVSVVRGQLRGEVHVKYFSERAREAGGQAYGRFDGEWVRGAGFEARYEGVRTLQSWAGIIGTHYSGREKELVDDLVERNDNVIDLEMGLPAWGRRTSALRMDLVTLEGGQVVFWEAKTAGDGRVRCRDDALRQKLPHVVEQLDQYRQFLVQDVHCWRIGEAYRKAAQVIVQLRELADQLGPPQNLGREIVAASEAAELRVAREAVLVVLDEAAPEGARWRSWHDNGHAEKLRGHVKVLAQSMPGRLVLGGAV